MPQVPTYVHVGMGAWHINSLEGTPQDELPLSHPDPNSTHHFLS
jgi:hypothetical protein